LHTTTVFVHTTCSTISTPSSHPATFIKLFLSSNLLVNPIKMDQNLEPKGDMELPEIIIQRLSAEESGIYFVGEISPKTLICTIENGWTDEQVQEYITVQLKLRPQCLKDRDRERAEASAKASSTSSSSSSSTTPSPGPYDEGDPTIKRPRPPRRSLKRKATTPEPGSSSGTPNKRPKTAHETDDDRKAV
jgi:hypothetical protein